MNDMPVRSYVYIYKRMLILRRPYMITYRVFPFLASYGMKKEEEKKNPLTSLMHWLQK